VLVRRNDSGGNDLFRFELATGALTRLTSSGGGWNWAPATSPDGQWLAFATGSVGASDIAIMRADGSGRAVVARSGDLAVGSPWWTPDGRIGFNGTSNGRWEIYSVGRTGGTATQLTHTPDIDGTRLPTWPRIGGPLAIAGKQTGLFRVFVQVPGGGFRTISPVGVEAYAPAWAPDGRRLAFQTGGAEPVAGIVTVAPDGTDLRRVVSPPPGAWVRAPVWSADGRWIAYVSSQGASAGDDYGDVFVVAADGSQARRLTFDGLTYDWRLAWLPQT
jgi:Tol biopolymer transport system component